MPTFLVHIDGTRDPSPSTYRRTTHAALLVASATYIRQALAAGRKLSSIEYCWTRVL